MATALKEESRGERLLLGLHRSTCARCGGLMVPDYCMDLVNSTGELECAAQRCVQCGEIVDPVIQRNRQIRHQTIVVRGEVAEIAQQPCD